MLAEKLQAVLDERGDETEGAQADHYVDQEPARLHREVLLRVRIVELVQGFLFTPHRKKAPEYRPGARLRPVGARAMPQPDAAAQLWFSFLQSIKGDRLSSNGPGRLRIFAFAARVGEGGL